MNYFPLLVASTILFNMSAVAQTLQVPIELGNGTTIIATCKANPYPTRKLLVDLTSENPKVLAQFDTFSKNLMKAYWKGEGFIDSDLIRIYDAVDFAAERHRTQTRKDAARTPYIIHPIGVANNLLTIGNVRDPDILIGALLHDTVEDTETSFEEIRDRFGARVEGFVREVTDDKSLPRLERKRLQIEHAHLKSAGAAQIKLGDKLYNLTDILNDPPPDWSKETNDTYFNWAKQVVDELPWVNAGLKKAVDKVIEQYGVVA